MNYDAQLRDQMEAVGLVPPDTLLFDGKLHRFSTNGKRHDDSGWYVAHDDGIPAGCFGDWRGGFSQTWRADIGRRLTPAEEAAHRARVVEMRRAAEAERAQKHRENGERNAALWSKCSPILPGDPASLYLKRRGFGALMTFPACLRFHPSLGYWDNEGNHLGNFPAMVAQVTDASGKLVALHRTYLTRAGLKADVPKVKKVTGASAPLLGCSIKLYPPHGWQLGVAEGIETALGAYFLSGVPCDAAYSAASVAAFRWPSGIKALSIFGDNDEAGTKAARELEARAKAAGIAAKTFIPTVPGDDWCDVWNARATTDIEAVRQKEAAE